MIEPLALPPDLPWWAELVMALVSAALGFFGGRRSVKR